MIRRKLFTQYVFWCLLIVVFFSLGVFREKIDMLEWVMSFIVYIYACDSIRVYFFRIDMYVPSSKTPLVCGKDDVMRLLLFVSNCVLAFAAVSYPY